MKSIVLPLAFAISALPLSGYGSVVFDFEGTELPVKALFENPTEITLKGNSGVSLEKSERNGQPETVAKVADKGVFLVSGNDRTLLAEFPALTISMSLMANEAVPTPIYFQRIHGSIGRAGYLSFHSQHNSGDPGRRKGTFRLAFTNDEGSKTITSSAPWEFIAGEWHSVAMVFNRGKVSFYLNGKQVGDPVDAPVETLPATSAGARVGVRSGVNFSGEIDDLVILPDRALSDEQIKMLHQEGTRSEPVQAFLKQ